MGSKSPFFGGWPQDCNVRVGEIAKSRSLLCALIVVAMVGSFFHLDSLKPNLYAQAYGESENNSKEASVKEAIKGEEKVFAVSEKEVSSCEQQKETPETIAKKKEVSSELENKLYDIVGEAPIKEMVPFIAERDQRVAALIVGIAKKESNWGSASPSKNGTTCYNYWGYKGAGSRGTSMGYGCFASAEEGVDVIGKRIGELVDKNLTTPSKMIVWKCGSASCTGHDPQSVRKWISDVDMYFRKVVTIEG